MSSDIENTPEPAVTPSRSRRKTPAPIIDLSPDEVSVVETKADVAAEPVVEAVADGAAEAPAASEATTDPVTETSSDVASVEPSETDPSAVSINEPVPDAVAVPPVEATPEQVAPSTEASNEPAVAAPDAPVVPPPVAPARRGFGSLLVAALLGGVVVLGGGYGLIRQGLVTLPLNLPAPVDLAPLTSRLDGLDAKLAAVPKPDISAVEGRIAKLEAQPAPDVAGLKSDVADLSKKLAALPVAVPNGTISADLAALPERVATLSKEAEALKGDLAALKTASGDKSALDGLTKSVGDLASRIDALPAPINGARVDSLETATKDLGAKVAGLPAPIDPARLDRLEASATALTAQVNALDAAMKETIAALTERTTTIEKRLDAGPRGGEIAAMSLSLAALSSRVASGEAFAGELAVVKAAKPDAAVLEALDALAAGGAPTAAALLASMPTTAILSARPESTSGGVLDALFSGAQSLVNYRETGDGVEDAAYKALAGIEAALKAGDFTAARSAADGLPDWGRSAAADWLKTLDQRAAAETALVQLTSGVLDRLKAPAQGQ